MVRRCGIEHVIHLDLDPAEVEGIRRSAGILKGVVTELGLG